MCSIIGYSGNEIAAPIIVKGLKRMEYRGYDSVGVATESDNGIELKKGTGKVNEVNSKIQLDKLPGKIGIGHTRWATHGKVTELNAHPHPSNSGKIAIVLWNLPHLLSLSLFLIQFHFLILLQLQHCHIPYTPFVLAPLR